jgi:two-component system, chemotaxis family, protein-glutamate methylesterase/glutaminase
MSVGRELVAIGASWGGLDALRSVLQPLPASFPAATVVVQHRSPESQPGAFCELLGAVTRLAVEDARDKQPLEPGHVYLAPADYHVLVEDDHLALSTEGPVAFARPSIDLLFESAAEARRAGCVGVVLTGANHDGAEGLARIVELGGAAIVQDPAGAVRAEMPRAALAAVPSALVVPLEGIPQLLLELCAPAEVTA